MVLSAHVILFEWTGVCNACLVFGAVAVYVVTYAQVVTAYMIYASSDCVRDLCASSDCVCVSHI